MGEHAAGPHTGTALGAVFKHNALPGHLIDLLNPTEVFKSDCYYTRVTVEAALIQVASTIPHKVAFIKKDDRHS